MKLIVLIASHINVIHRIKSMIYALRSIQNNTVKPDHVYLSYSTEHEFDIKLWSNELKNIEHTFIKQDSRKLQFEHYYFLKEYVSDTDIVTFLDDDDILHRDKFKIVKEFIKEYETEKDIKVFCHRHSYFGLFESIEEHVVEEVEYESNYKEDEYRSNFFEYFDYCIYGIIFKNWFINGSDNMSFDDILYVYRGFADLAFVIYLSNIPLIIIDKCLYHKRSQNLKVAYMTKD